MNRVQILYTLALTLTPGIGPVNAKSLISYCGSAEKIFKTRKHTLLKIPGIGENTVTAIEKSDVLNRAEEELKFIEAKRITVLTYFDEEYPKRLKNCIDSPVLLFFKGNADLNNPKVVGIVGTRMATDYGKNICDELIDQLAPYNILLMSGLAYGIDIAAHRACIRKDVTTVGILGHGLDMIYPGGHKDTAKKMIDNGGLLTEFISQTQPDRQNFPKRNRIVAGMIDALIVVETAENGGAVITAALANSYNREVFAFPGSINQKYSKGCNYLIKKNRAALVENADDILDALSWKETVFKKPVTQRELFIELTPEEKILFDIIRDNKELSIDELNTKSSFSPGMLASNLLNLEFQGIIAALPGKRYRIL